MEKSVRIVKGILRGISQIEPAAVPVESRDSEETQVRAEVVITANVAGECPTSPVLNIATCDAATSEDIPRSGSCGPSSQNNRIEAPTSDAATSRPGRRAMARAAHSVAFDCWNVDLDYELRGFCKGGREGERQAILSIRTRFPDISAEIIWSRILYLGLSTAKRRPYMRHEWTADDVELLAAGYSDGRHGATNAINVLLRMHPDWSRSLISRKAKSLGLAHARPKGYQPWSQEADRRLISCEGFLMESVEERLKRSRGSILSRLAALDRGMEFFGGFKTKELMTDLHLAEAQIRRLERNGLLVRERGRITEKSVAELCRSHPEEIPFETLSPEWQCRLVQDYHYRKPKMVRRGGRKSKATSGTARVSGTAAGGGVGSASS